MRGAVLVVFCGSVLQVGPELFSFSQDKKALCLRPPMKQLLLLFGCFSLSIRLVSADCDEIHGAKGPTPGSRKNIEVYYRDEEHHRKFILLNRNPYDVHVDYTVGGERRTRMINANKCEDFLGHGYCKVLSVRRAH